MVASLPSIISLSHEALNLEERDDKVFGSRSRSPSRRFAAARRDAVTVSHNSDIFSSTFTNERSSDKGTKFDGHKQRLGL